MTPNVRTTTSNLADLMAFTKAMVWAARDLEINNNTPICIRYSNEYAANVATGVWRAKKHKQAAEAARRAWGTLRRQQRNRVWMSHTATASPLHGRWLKQAEEAATAARLTGARVYRRQPQ